MIMCCEAYLALFVIDSVGKRIWYKTTRKEPFSIPLMAPSSKILLTIGGQLTTFVVEGTLHDNDRGEGYYVIRNQQGGHQNHGPILNDNRWEKAERLVGLSAW